MLRTGRDSDAIPRPLFRGAGGLHRTRRDDPHCAKFSQNAVGRLPTAGLNLSAGLGLPLCRPTLIGPAAVNKRSIPILSVNQFDARATNESGVFAGVGRERHRRGASCIVHAHWRPLPPHSCALRLRLVGDEALVLLSEVFFHL